MLYTSYANTSTEIKCKLVEGKIIQQLITKYKEDDRLDERRHVNQKNSVRMKRNDPLQSRMKSKNLKTLRRILKDIIAGTNSFSSITKRQVSEGKGMIAVE